MGFSSIYRPNSVQGADSVFIEGPASGFGELRVSLMTPQAQGDFVHGISKKVFTTASFSGGTVTSTEGMCSLQSGTNADGSATVQLRRGLKYRPGQASLMRITTLFDEPSSGNAQFVGAGTSECGYFVGYFGSSFGVLHSNEGQREVRTYKVTNTAGTDTLTVTLDGSSVSVPVVGGSSNTQTAYQIASANYTQIGKGGWIADVVGDTVYFVSARSSPFLTGSYSIAGSTIVGSFTREIPGQTSQNVFYPSSSFNIDTLDGNGPTGMVFNPQKGNVFEIAFQYLGFGDASFKIEDPESGRLTEFHIIKNANSRTTPVLKDPNVSALATSANIGGTISKTLKTASIGAFIEGNVAKLDPKFSKSFTFSGVNSSTYVPLFLLKVNRIFNGKSCFGEIDLTRIIGANTVNNQALTIGAFLDPRISGNVNYENVSSEESIASYAILDPAVNTITNLSSILPFHEVLVGSNTSAIDDLETMLYAFGVGREVLIAIKTTGSINGLVGINWFEQQ